VSKPKQSFVSNFDMQCKLIAYKEKYTRLLEELQLGKRGCKRKPSFFPPGSFW
jgi:hypothetical protein